MKMRKLYDLIILFILCMVCFALLSGCDLIYDLLAHVHNYTKSTVAPTCETEGYTLYSCICGDFYKEDIVPARGHTEVIDPAVEASCLRAGLSSGIHCEVCGKIIQAQVIIAQLEHQDEEHDGYCNVCGTHFEDIIDIDSVEDFKNISNNMSGAYRLTSDISLNGIEWIALGSASEWFSGKLYGMGHKISGLDLHNQSESGLFAYNAGVIDGLVLNGISLSLQDMSGAMGGLVAYNKGIISNCMVEGNFSISNTIYHYEEKKWPSYDGTAVSFTGVFGGLCAVNEGNIINCQFTAVAQCDYSNTNEYQLRVAFPYFECGHSSSSTSNIYFGGITGKNLGTVESCIVSGLHRNTIALLAKYKNHGTSTAITNSYIGSLVGYNANTIKNSRAIKSTFIKDVGTTSLKGSGLNSYGIVCELNFYEDSTFAGIIGKNDGNASNVLYY